MQLHPKVAAFPDNGFVMVWESFAQDGSAGGAFGQIFDTEGSPAADEFQANSYVHDEQFHPRVTALDNGRFAVIWDGSGEGDSFGVFGRLFEADGTPVTDEFMVNTLELGYQELSRVEALPGGRFLVLWKGYGDEDHQGAYARIFGEDSTPEGGHFLVNTFTSGVQLAPAAAVLADGSFVIAWESMLVDDEAAVKAQWFTSSGEKDGEEFPVNTSPMSWLFHLSASASANGSLVMVWDSCVADNASDALSDSIGCGVFAQRFNPAGEKNGTEFQVNSFVASDQWRSAVAAFPDGSFVVTWESWGDQDGDGCGIFAQRFDENGVKLYQ